ncbi:hypothetical protein SERLA73DRAFT_45096, partial [Serpula lacrymans var. lacrymans S7.3]
MCTYSFQKKIRLDVGVENLARGIVHPTSVLLDSGTNGIFIDQVWAEQMGLPLVKLDIFVPVYNNNTQRCRITKTNINVGGCITHKCSFVVEYQGHREQVTAEATQLGKINLILVWTWLFEHNPEIDWQTGVVTLS